MEIPWPLNTSFHIHSSQDGNQNWILSNKFDRQNKYINKDSALGKALMLSGEDRSCSYITPDGLVDFIILGIKPPEADWDIFSSPIDYYRDMFNKDLSEIRYYQFMANICLNCGRLNPPTLPGKRTCEECSTSWHTNHCWNCRSPVDSRDPKTPLCDRKCGGCVCANCGSCFCGNNFLWKRSDDLLY
jgi:hypothetical protein